MIKLFGWRPLAEANVAAKRDAELRLIWRSRVIGFANFFVKCVVAHEVLLSEAD